MLVLVRNVLELATYQKLQVHSDGFIADILNVPLLSVGPRIRLLEQVGIIRREEDGPYKLIAEGLSDTGVARSASKRIAELMRQRVADRAQKQVAASPDYKHAFLIYPTHEKLEEQVFKLARQFYIDVRNLVETCDKGMTDRIGFLGVDCMCESAATPAEERWE